MKKVIRLVIFFSILIIFSNCEKNKNPLLATTDSSSQIQPDTSVITPNDSFPDVNSDYTIIENFRIKNILKTADGGYLAIDNISDNNLNILKKFNQNYQEIWTHILDIPVNKNNYWPAAITILSDNSIIAATGSDSTIYCTKLDENGKLVWQKEYGINGEVKYVAEIVIINENEILLLCHVKARACHPTEPGYCFSNYDQNLLIAMDQNGLIIWTNNVYKWGFGLAYSERIFQYTSGYITINLNIDMIDDLVIFWTDISGNFSNYLTLGGKTLDFSYFSNETGLILGTNNHWYSSMNNFQLVLIDSFGNLVWQSEATPQYEGSDAFIDDQDNIIVLGDYVGCESPGLCNRKDYKIWLAKYNMSGEQIASWLYNEMEYSEGIKFFKNPDGSYTVFGNELKKTAEYRYSFKNTIVMRVDASVLDGTNTGIEE